jgi:hypothetical protein
LNTDSRIGASALLIAVRNIGGVTTRCYIRERVLSSLSHTRAPLGVVGLRSRASVTDTA